MESQIRLEFKESLAIIYIASDENPYISPGFVEELKEVIDQLNQNQKIKVVIFKGGLKNFCLGENREALMAEEHLEKFPLYVAEIPRLILSIPIPTIACMTGHSIEGGLVLGLWCDLAALSESSLYGANFMPLGFTPSMGGTIVMKQAFGDFVARRLLFTGKLIKGREIRISGCPISANVFDRDNIEAHCLDWAEAMMKLPLVSIKKLKENQVVERRAILEKALKEEQSMQEELVTQEEIQKFIHSRHQQLRNHD